MPGARGVGNSSLQGWHHPASFRIQAGGTSLLNLGGGGGGGGGDGDGGPDDFNHKRPPPGIFGAAKGPNFLNEGFLQV